MKYRAFLFLNLPVSSQKIMTFVNPTKVCLTSPRIIEVIHLTPEKFQYTMLFNLNVSVNGITFVC